MYWTKSFLFGGLAFPFETDWRRYGPNTVGIGYSIKFHVIRRFELHTHYYNPRASLSVLDEEDRLTLNRLFSQIGSIRAQVNEVNRFNIIRLFLIRSFRGKAQAFGKPSHGQRTWSNAWTSYLYNKELRTFISEMQKKLDLEKKEEKINYKLLKKKTAQTDNRGQMKDEKKKGVFSF